MYSTKFDPRILTAMRKFISEDETRYALNGILVEPSLTTTRLVATDGRRMIVLESKWQTLECAPFIIPATVLPFLERRQGRADYELEFDGRKLLFSIPQFHEIFRLQCDAIDATYPNWRSICPPQLPQKFAANMRLNFEFLRDISDALEILDPQRSMGIRYTSEDEESPLFISGPGFVMVQMPMRKEGAVS